MASPRPYAPIKSYLFLGLFYFLVLSSTNQLEYDLTTAAATTEFIPDSWNEVENAAKELLLEERHPRVHLEWLILCSGAEFGVLVLSDVPVQGHVLKKLWQATKYPKNWVLQRKKSHFVSYPKGAITLLVYPFEYRTPVRRLRRGTSLWQCIIISHIYKYICSV